jgi:cell division protein FtsW (lipid II flippase)
MIPGALRHYLRYTSWPILMAMVALMGVGIAAIHVSQSAAGSSTAHVTKQTIYAGVGLAVFVAMTVVPFQRIGRAAYPLFGATLVVLAVLAAARITHHDSSLIPNRRGAYRWIDLGPVDLQPSELAKLTFIVLLAWYLRQGDRYRKLRGLLVPFALTLVPMGLVLIEPDLGTSLLFLPTLYFMLFMAGAKWRHLLGIVAIGTALVFLPVPQRVEEGWSRQERRDRRSLAYASFKLGEAEHLLAAAPLTMMEGHQFDRIDGWLRQGDPRVARDKGFQLHWSKMVLGGGKLTGRRDWPEADVYFRLLPDDHTDFIFSIIGGQWGLVGCLGVLGLYGVIFLFGIEIAVITHDPFGRLLAVGVLGLLLSQLVVNVGMTMGLMPITGMTLPLISYGGSSLVVNCAALGLLVNVGQRRPILLSRRPFEHGRKRRKPPGAATAMGEGSWREEPSAPRRPASR